MVMTALRGTKDTLLETLLALLPQDWAIPQGYLRSLAQYQQTSCCAAGWPCRYESEPEAPSPERLGVHLPEKTPGALDVEVETMVSLVLMMPEVVFTKHGDAEDRLTAWSPESTAS
jgi:hypothetical protein